MSSRRLARRRMAASLLLTLLPALLLQQGCRLQVSQDVVYLPERARQAPVRSPKRNDLKVGVKSAVVVDAEGVEADLEALAQRDIDTLLAETLRDTLIFQEVHAPLRDEAVDVLLEPRLVVTLAKNRFTNAVKVFPGVVFPWIDGMGFDYDLTVRLEVAVKDVRGGGKTCANLTGDAAMTAERYPSILFFVGLHAGLLVLLVFESVTTDGLVLERLGESSIAHAYRPVLEALARDFSPTAKPCPDHPNVAQPGRYCLYCSRDLYYPLLAPAAKPKAP